MKNRLLLLGGVIFTILFAHVSNAFAKQYCNEIVTELNAGETNNQTLTFTASKTGENQTTFILTSETSTLTGIYEVVLQNPGGGSITLTVDQWKDWTLQDNVLTKVVTWDVYPTSSIQLHVVAYRSQSAGGSNIIGKTIADIDISSSCIEEELPPGTMRGTYRIGGEKPDFISLEKAFTAINEANAEGKIIGDIRLLVCANLESKNVGIQNSSDYTITLTVDAAAARKITFTQTADNAGPSGNICIGCDMSLTHACANVLTQNVIIDGSFNGDGERWLTLETAANVNIYNGPILIYGYVKDCTIRNTNMFVSNNNSGKQNFCVSIRNQNVANSTYAPDGIVVENNYMENVSGTMSGVIYLQKSANGTGKPANVKVLNNIIKAVHRAVLCEHANNMMFVGNNFKVNQTSAQSDSYAILPVSNPNTNIIEGDVIIRNNVFSEITTKCTDANNGITAISVTGGGRWYIENNYFTGFDNYSPSANGKLMAIRTGGGQEFIKIRHNTFYMPTLSNVSATALMSANPVSLIYAAGGTPEIENNIFVVEEKQSNVSIIRGSLNENVKNNVFYHNGGNAAVVAAAPTSMTWENFIGSWGQRGSVWKMPVFVDAANGNLDLKEGDEILLMPRLDEVLTDIYGTERAEQTYAGAFEYPTLPTIDKLSIDKVVATEVVLNVASEKGVKYYVEGNGKTWEVAPVDGKITVSGLNPNTSYTLTVKAVDAYDNKSDNSLVVSFVTLPNQVPANTEDLADCQVYSVWGTTKYESHCDPINNFEESPVGTFERLVIDDKTVYHFFNTTGGNIRTKDMNVTTYDRLHFSVWSSADFTFKMALYGWQNGFFFSDNLDVNAQLAQWVEIDVPITDFGTFPYLNPEVGFKLSELANNDILIANVYFYSSSNQCDAKLTTEPTAPTYDKCQVHSIYSRKYSDIGMSFAAWGGASTGNETIIEDTKMYNVSANHHFGLEYKGKIDASKYEYLHLDVWTPTEITFDFAPICWNYSTNSNEGEKFVNLKTNGGTWTSFDISVSRFLELGLTMLANYQLKFDNISSETNMYVANVFFYNSSSCPSYSEPKIVNSHFGTAQQLNIPLYSDADMAGRNANLNKMLAQRVDYYIVDCGEQLLTKVVTKGRFGEGAYAQMLLVWDDEKTGYKENYISQRNETRTESYIRINQYPNNQYKWNGNDRTEVPMNYYLSFVQQSVDIGYTDFFTYKRGYINFPNEDNIAPTLSSVSLVEENDYYVIQFAGANDNSGQWFYYIESEDLNIYKVSLEDTIRIARTLDGRKLSLNCYAVDFNGNMSVAKEVNIEMPFAPNTNLALEKPSFAGNCADGFGPEKANDKEIGENFASRWGFNKNPSDADWWWYVDLQGYYKLKEIQIWFDNAHPTEYKLYVAQDLPEDVTDDSKWDVIYETTTEPKYQGGTASNDETYMNQYKFDDKNVIARYVRIKATKSSMAEWGISIWDFRVYGSEVVEKTPSKFIIYHTGQAPDDRAIEQFKGGEITQPIEYRRKFNLDTWYSICFPFKVNRVAVYNEVDGQYYDLKPYYRDADGYHSRNYIIRTPSRAEGMQISKFEESWEDPESDEGYIPASNTPYIIQFHNTYYKNRWICFFGKAEDEIATALDDDYKAPADNDKVNIYANNTMMPQDISGYSYHLNYEQYGGTAWTRYDDHRVNPFECYILANDATSARYMILRRGAGDSGTTTSVDGLQDDQLLSVLRVYTQTGLLLRQYQDITLTDALADMQTTAAEGTYIFVSAGQTWKIMLNGQR